MRYKLVVHPGAEDDTDVAYDWYESKQDGLGGVFLEELEAYYLKLEQNPEIFSWVDEQHRQAILDKFPYVILYEIVLTEVHVYAVFHTSRNPEEKFIKR